MAFTRRGRARMTIDEIVAWWAARWRRKPQTWQASAEMRGQTTLFMTQPFIVPVGPTRVLTITITPPNPVIPSTTPLGATVATLSAHWSDNSPFTGGYLIGPASDPTAIYAIDLNLDHTGNLKINPSGPGVGAQGGTIQDLIIEAYQ